MRGKRLKQYKKSLSIYQNTFGFRLPLQILVDGTIINVSEKHKLDLSHLLPRTLSVKDIKIFYTSCIIKELESFGDDTKKAVYRARKNFEWRSCPHKDDCIPARQCVLDMVGDNNEHKFIVCTQDIELRKILRKVPCVPLVYINNSVCILEPTSAATEAEADRIENAKTLPASYEKIGCIEDASQVKKKKRKISEPNPLSCRKKQKSNPNSQPIQDKPKAKRGSRGRKKRSTTENRANGKLGSMVCKSVLEVSDKSVSVKAILRKKGNTSSNSPELEDLIKKYNGRITIVQVDYSSTSDLSKSLENVYCVVSCLLGLRDVIVDIQSVLLKSALENNVRRFIPSDFAANFLNLEPGLNRNFDLRKEFHTVAKEIISSHKNEIEFTSIFQGAFFELIFEIGTVDLNSKTVGYMGSPDIKCEYTTWKDTALYTAYVAIDENKTPESLFIAGGVLNAEDFAKAASSVVGEQFSMKQTASLWFLGTLITILRFVYPSENEVFPIWQKMQYGHNMASGACKAPQLDNARYPVKFETVEQVIQSEYQKKVSESK